MSSNRTLIFGIGVNDLSYPVTEYKNQGGKTIQTWICPFYACWKYMMDRSYNPKRNNSAYEDASVCNSWHFASNFKAWMEVQQWKGKHLDKDILVIGNKLYSPETCVFVPEYLNSFFIRRSRVGQKYPIGVSKQNNQYIARCGDVYLGRFYSEAEAHQAWKEYKAIRLLEFMDKYSSEEEFPDSRLVKSLENRLKLLEVAIKEKTEVGFL